MKNDEIEVIFQPFGKRGKFRPNILILEAAKSLGINISTLCAGKGTCGKCKVKVLKGTKGLTPLTENEIKHIAKEESEASIRLACQAKLSQPSIIFIPETSRVGKQRLQIEGLNVDVKLDSPVKKYFLKLPVPTLQDHRSDEDRILDALKEKNNLVNLQIDYETSKKLPIALREAKWEVTVVLFRDKIIAIESGDTTERNYGFAADIGSTKLAGFLINLRTGEVVSVAARMNPQIPYGEDVLSRITHCVMHGRKGQEELHNVLVSGINEIIDECCEKASVKTEEIYELNFVGNTAMQMLFLKLWPQYTSLSPYPPVLRRGVDIEASALGLRSYPNANVHFLPVIGGFVGADNVAVVLATKMLESEETALSIDIGTNTEIDLGSKDGVMACSCASGPAFEGMHIKYGMRAATGAIEKISIDHENFEVQYKTIEDEPAVGICGSGLVDALSELLKAGAIDMNGRFNNEIQKKSKRLQKTPEGWYEYVLAWKNEAAVDSDITVTQADIRELQKAKAAMRTGAEIMLKNMNLTKDDVDVLYIAGAFGNYIDPESARMIGMYPEIPLEKIKLVGNTAGTGSKMCLVSEEMRRNAEKISEMVQYYELAIDPNFQSEYINALYIPSKDLSKQPVVTEILQKLGRL